MLLIWVQIPFHVIFIAVLLKATTGQLFNSTVWLIKKCFCIAYEFVLYTLSCPLVQKAACSQWVLPHWHILLCLLVVGLRPPVLCLRGPRVPPLSLCWLVWLSGFFQPRRSLLLSTGCVCFTYPQAVCLESSLVWRSLIKTTASQSAAKQAQRQRNLSTLHTNR